MYETEAPTIPPYVFMSGLPVLGICYGMQALSFALGGAVNASSGREYGQARLLTHTKNPLIPTG